MLCFHIFRQTKNLLPIFCSPQLINPLTRKSSTYKRSQLSVPHADHLLDMKKELFEQRTELSDSEWQELQNNLISKYKHISNSNVDAIILGLCGSIEQLPLAKNYVHYLRKCGFEPNLATIGRLLRIYNTSYHKKGGNDASLTPEEQQDIFDIYAKLRETYIQELD